MYRKQVEHMMGRFEEARQYIRTHSKLEALLKGKGKTLVEFCEDFENNSELLHQIALYLAKQVTNTDASSYTYASAIAYIAETLGYEYEVYSGLAVNKEKEKKLYDKVKGTKYDEYNVPFMANYVFVRVNDVDYDYLNGFDNIEHIYVEEMK